MTTTLIREWASLSKRLPGALTRLPRGRRRALCVQRSILLRPFLFVALRADADRDDAWRWLLFLHVSTARSSDRETRLTLERACSACSLVGSFFVFCPALYLLRVRRVFSRRGLFRGEITPHGVFRRPIAMPAQSCAPVPPCRCARPPRARIRRPSCGRLPSRCLCRTFSVSCRHVTSVVPSSCRSHSTTPH